MKCFVLNLTSTALNVFWAVLLIHKHPALAIINAWAAGLGTMALIVITTQWWAERKR